MSLLPRAFLDSAERSRGHRARIIALSVSPSAPFKFSVLFTNEREVMHEKKSAEIIPMTTLSVFVTGEIYYSSFMVIKLYQFFMDLSLFSLSR